MRLIGLDIGTTGCKAHIFDEFGVSHGNASREYPVDIPQPNWVEQEIEVVWALAVEALTDVVSKDGNGTNVLALSLSVHGEAVTPIDSDGNPLRPTILGMDTRTDEQNEWIREVFGARHIFEKTGMPVHTINTLPKLLWIKKNEPDIWEQAYQFLLVEDYFIRKLTSKAVISSCLASRTQLYDIENDDWSNEILYRIGLERTRLATIKPSGTAVSVIRPEIAKRLGISESTLIVTGGHDQACGALGVGLSKPGLAMVSTGTAEVVEVALGTPKLNETLFQGNISVYRHVIPDLYLAMTLNHSGGLLLRWFRDEFCQPEIAQAIKSGEDAYDLILADVSEEPSPVMVLPHFSGSGTPMFDTDSKGAILGLTFNTTKQDLAKAILEGLTFELRLNLDLLKSGEIRIDELRAIGGGARSPLWLQLKADITGIPIVVPKVTEAAGLGAAILAGVGAGVYPNAHSAIEKILEFNKTHYPDIKQKQKYENRFEIYKDIYPTIKNLAYRF